MSEITDDDLRWLMNASVSDMERDEAPAQMRAMATELLAFRTMISKLAELIPHVEAALDAAETRREKSRWSY